jgi:hypothetical protein
VRPDLEICEETPLVPENRLVMDHERHLHRVLDRSDVVDVVPHELLNPVVQRVALGEHDAHAGLIVPRQPQRTGLAAIIVQLLE